MTHVLLDSFLISLLHAFIPSHWLALVVIGRAEKWTLETTLKATLLAGLAHIGSTILLGSLVGYLGFKLSKEFSVFSHFVTPAVLIGVGTFFLISAFFHTNKQEVDKLLSKRPRSIGSWFTTITLTLFFSPCLEMTSYFLTAGTHGWRGILVVALVFMGVTLPVMLAFVALGYKGLHRYKSSLLDRHGHTITGLLLIGLGFISFFYA